MRTALLGCLLLSACFIRRAVTEPTPAGEVVNYENRLRKLAGFQFNCPEAELKVVDLGQGEKAGVTGCGHRATYSYSDGDNGPEWHRSDVETPVVRD